MNADEALAKEFENAKIPKDVHKHFNDLLQRHPHPVLWNSLPAGVAEDYWRELDQWVTWLKTTFGLPPAIVPPLWHRHDELIWELAALHGRFHDCYAPSAGPSGPILWMRDFAEARDRLREWVAICGTRLDRDRPTRHTVWPGERPQLACEEVEVLNRADDFDAFVAADIDTRVQEETAA